VNSGTKANNNRKRASTKRKIMSSPGESEFKDNEKCRVQELISGVTAIKIKTPPPSPIPGSLLDNSGGSRVMVPSSAYAHPSAAAAAASGGGFYRGIRLGSGDGFALSPPTNSSHRRLLASSPPQLPPSSSRYLRQRYPPDMLHFKGDVPSGAPPGAPQGVGNMAHGKSSAHSPPSSTMQNKQNSPSYPHAQPLGSWVVRNHRGAHGGRSGGGGSSAVGLFGAAMMGQRAAGAAAATAASGLARRVFHDTVVPFPSSAGPTTSGASSLGGGIVRMRTDEEVISCRPHQQSQSNSLFGSKGSAGVRAARTRVAGGSAFSQLSSQPQHHALLVRASDNSDDSAMDVDNGGVPLRIAQLRRESLTEAYPMVSARRRFLKKRRVGSGMAGSRF
jgi:hypothetical protein